MTCSYYRPQTRLAQPYPVLLIELKLKQGSKLTITYEPEKERELTWSQGSPEAQLLFDDDKNPYFYEKEIGIFHASTKQTCFEFHVHEQNEKLLHKHLQTYGLSWGHRIYRGPQINYLVGAATIILPFNYQNIIQ